MMKQSCRFQSGGVDKNWAGNCVKLHDGFKPRTVRVLVALAKRWRQCPFHLAPGMWFHFLWIVMHTSDRWNVGVGFSARIKAAYSVPTKTKRLSYRGLEKGVTLGGEKSWSLWWNTHKCQHTSIYILYIKYNTCYQASVDTVVDDNIGNISLFCLWDIEILYLVIR